MLDCHKDEEDGDGGDDGSVNGEEEGRAADEAVDLEEVSKVENEVEVGAETPSAFALMRAGAKETAARAAKAKLENGGRLERG